MPEMNRIYRAPPADAALLWPAVEPLLKPALATTYGCYLAVDILAGILAGKFQLWFAVSNRIDAAMVTELVLYPRRKSCRVFLIGGKKLKHWQAEFTARVEEFARAEGCNLMEGGGRRGWARLAGYQETGCVLIKEL